MKDKQKENKKQKNDFKKKKKNQKIKNKKKTSKNSAEKNLEKEWKKLKEKIKDNLTNKSENRREQKSELEEEIKKEREVKKNQNQFNNFSQSFNTEVKEIPTTNLNKITNQFQERNLEQSFNPLFTNQEQENEPLKYNISQTTQNTRDKYQNNTTLRPLRVHEESERDLFLNPTENTIINQQDIDTDRMNVGFMNQERRLPFEQEDERYKEYKLRKTE